MDEIKTAPLFLPQTRDAESAHRTMDHAENRTTLECDCYRSFLELLLNTVRHSDETVLSRLIAAIRNGATMEDILLALLEPRMDESPLKKAGHDEKQLGTWKPRILGTRRFPIGSQMQ
jgi:hypothetical protein